MLNSLALLCLAVCAVAADSATLEVPGAYATIQSALDAAHPGDTVYVRAGTYLEGLVLPPGVMLKGEGKQLVTVRRRAADGPVLTVSGCADGAVHEITMEHVERPEEDTADAKPAPVVEIADSTVELYRCEIRNGGGSGIRAQGTSKCKVLCCVIADCARIGVVVAGPEASGTLVGNTSTGNLCGLAFHENAKGTARLNRCEGNRYYGIEAQSAARPVLFRNTCAENWDSGIACRSDAQVVVEGNRCVANGDTGIELQGNAVASLQYNTLENNAWYGIFYGDECRASARHNRYLNNHELNKDETYFIFRERDYAELEALASHLRANKVRSYAGEWELEILYNGIVAGCDDLDGTGERSYLLAMGEWKKQYPNSVTRAVAEAMAYREFAWRERGGGWASEVSSEGWKAFKQYLGKGLAVLVEAEKYPERDPHLYAVKQDILRGLNKDSAALPPILLVLGWWTDTHIELPSPVEQAFLQGVSIEPTYYPLYDARSVALQPRWGGSAEETVKFAESSAARTAALEGDLLYARLAIRTFRREGRESFLRDYRYSWPRIRQGFRDMLRVYPDAISKLNMFCFMACLHGDRRTANELFERIGDEWHSYAWESEAHFNNWKEWAQGNTPSPTTNPLEEAVRNDDATEVERLLRAGTPPNSLAENGRSLLVVAINEECIEAAKTLLANGADPNFIPEEGTSPVEAASWNAEDDTMLRLLFEQKANPNVKSDAGWSPLLYAATHGNSRRIRLLLEHGADPNDSVSGLSAVYYAIERGDLDSVQALVEKGADVNRSNGMNETPLTWTEKFKRADIAAYLREHGAK